MGKKNYQELSETMKEASSGVTQSKLDPTLAEKEEQFLFGVCSPLGIASNSYAEYVALILA